MTDLISRLEKLKRDANAKPSVIEEETHERNQQREGNGRSQGNRQPR